MGCWDISHVMDSSIRVWVVLSLRVLACIRRITGTMDGKDGQYTDKNNVFNLMTVFRKYPDIYTFAFE